MPRAEHNLLSIDAAVVSGSSLRRKSKGPRAISRTESEGFSRRPAAARTPHPPGAIISDRSPAPAPPSSRTQPPFLPRPEPEGSGAFPLDGRQIKPASRGYYLHSSPCTAIHVRPPFTLPKLSLEAESGRPPPPRAVPDDSLAGGVWSRTKRTATNSYAHIPQQLEHLATLAGRVS